MGNTDKFLSTYKMYEGVLREDGLTPRDVEDKWNESQDEKLIVRAERLKMCRWFRNYMSHVNDPGFIEPTPKMLAFMDSEVKALRSEQDAAGKHVKNHATSVLKWGMTCEHALTLFANTGCLYMPVQMRDGNYKVLKLHDVLKAGRLVKLADVKKCSRAIVFCSPMDLYKDLDPEKIVLCTDDGTKKGLLMGRVWFNDVQM